MLRKLFPVCKTTFLETAVLICNTQQVATHRNGVAKHAKCCAQHCCDMLRLKCYNHLAGACKYWASDIAICCIKMLRSFGWGLNLDFVVTQ